MEPEKIIRKMWSTNAFMNVLKIQIKEVHCGGATLEMPIDFDIHTNHWLGVHGGAMAALADCVTGITCVSIGNPHCVIFGKDPDMIDLEKIGPHFEHFEKFPERINTEFIEVLDNHTLKMRVWERGSGETMACGTGACASAVAACLNGYCKKGEDITVKLRGGDLVINYTDDGVQMTGSADTVFTGIVEI